MSIREFKLERYFARWEFNAPYLLSASDCETMAIGELLALADVPLSALAELRLGYTQSQGDPTLRARSLLFIPPSPPTTFWSPTLRKKPFFW